MGAGEAMSGTLYGIGVGPGDPELITLKAHRLLTQAPIIAYPAPDTGESFARAIVARYLSADQIEVPIVVPMRVARFPARAIYDQAAATLAAHLNAGRDVVVLCEGDPFFYGSFMYLHARLAGRYPVEIIPGISSVMAGGAALGRPLAARNDVLSVIPAPLPDERISAQIAMADAVAIIKLGRHFSRIRTLLEKMNLTASSAYLERISLGHERVLPLASVREDSAPYFSMILIYKGGEAWGSEVWGGEAQAAPADPEALI
jgi:precorrin-2/cobalt-factor-2 C20-methyltransferase